MAVIVLHISSMSHRLRHWSNSYKSDLVNPWIALFNLDLISVLDMGRLHFETKTSSSRIMPINVAILCRQSVCNIWIIGCQRRTIQVIWCNVFHSIRVNLSDSTNYCYILFYFVSVQVVTNTYFWDSKSSQRFQSRWLKIKGINAAFRILIALFLTI